MKTWDLGGDPVKVKESALLPPPATATPAHMEEPPEQPTFSVDGNDLTLLDTGPRRFAAVLALIEGAKSNLRLLYYIYGDDDSGKKVREALVAAAKRGVRISLIVDAFGSSAADNDGFFKPLREAGADICQFEPKFGRRYLLRNHQKLAIADDSDVLIGGFNIEDAYFGKPADDAWRDLGLAIHGPVAGRIIGYFDALSAWVRRPGGKIRDLRRDLNEFSETEGATRWLIGGPTRRLSKWAKALRGDIRGAKRVDIIAAYFAPTPAMLRRFDRAGTRGAKVRIVTAGKSDNNTTIAAARFTYAGLLRKNVEIHEYQPTKLHTKLYCVDQAVHIGSANFDVRSLFLNLELMLRIEDKAFSEHVRAYIDGEIAESQHITKAHWKARMTLWRRIKQSAAYFAIAVLDYNVTRRLNFGLDGR
jgi:cardiolipin synthase